MQSVDVIECDRLSALEIILSEPGPMKNRKLVVALFLLCLLSICILDVSAQTKSRRTRRRTPKVAVSKVAPAGVTTPSGLTYLITKKGTGRQPKTGETVVIHYTGTLTNGVKFDSSRDREQVFAFKLGVGQVIKGWDEGVAKLRVGDQAIMVIPSTLGYGSRGAGDAIPPDSTLIFIVEVVDVKARSMVDILSTTLKEKGIEAMVSEFHSLKSAPDPDLYVGESDINGFGYTLLRRRMVNEGLAVLKLNVEAYPQSANVYDSLAEAYLLSGDKEKAIENYRKALAIDPTMESAKQALKQLTGQ